MGAYHLFDMNPIPAERGIYDRCRCGKEILDPIHASPPPKRSRLARARQARTTVRAWFGRLRGAYGVIRGDLLAVPPYDVTGPTVVSGGECAPLPPTYDLYVRPDGRRQCRECKKGTQRARRTIK